MLPEAFPKWRTVHASVAIWSEPRGHHLGYRRRARKGTWFARYLDPAAGGYVTSAIGEADDTLEADGRTVFTYKQAMERALRWIELEQSGGPAAANDPDLTVAQAIDIYIAWRDARRSSQAGRAVKSDAHYKLTSFVLEDGSLPHVRLADLTEADLIAWQLRLAARKPASLQRIVNDLKAALNAAFIANRRVMPADLPTTIKPWQEE